MSRPGDPARRPPPRDPASSPGISRPGLTWLAAASLCLAGLGVYANSFAGRFVFDDDVGIVNAPELERIWPGLGEFLARQRTLTTLTLALNRAWSGLEPWSYHCVNVLVHVLAGVTLFGVVGRTLRLARFEGRFQRTALPLAWSTAMLWMLHPLHTESVTYVIQRSEALMGLFYLLALYCTLRAATSGRSTAWQALAVVACALGMGSKPVMITAPVVIALFDRMFLAESWRELVKQRAFLYLGLALSWIVVLGTGLLGHVLGAGQAVETTIGFGMKDVTATSYALTQAGVILHYLRLSLWPDTLVIDYGWPMVESPTAAFLPGLVVVALLVASGVAVAKRRTSGFLGAWFFLILAPTSSIVPVRDAAFEHRMYLPLAAVAAGVVLGGHALLVLLAARAGLSAATAERAAWACFAVAALALGARTLARNEDYSDEVVLWQKTVRDAPDNGRATTLLAACLARHGRTEEAIEALHSGVERMRSARPTAYTLMYLAKAHDFWGNILRTRGLPEQAIPHYEEALAAWPTMTEAHVNLAGALRSVGQHRAALARYEEALRLAPGTPSALNNLAWLLATSPDDSIRDGERAVALADEVARSNGYRSPSSLDTLAAAHAEAGNFQEAIRFEEAAMQHGSPAEQALFRERLAGYREGRPFRE